MRKTLGKNYTKLDDNVSFQIVRTNPVLTTNVKLLYDGDGMYLESYETNDILNTYSYKHHRVYPSGLFNKDLKKFWSSVNDDSIYLINQKILDTKISDNVDNMFENLYWCGVEKITSSLYKNEYGCVAPLYLNKKIPNYFVVFKVDDDKKIQPNKFTSINYDDLRIQKEQDIKSVVFKKPNQFTLQQAVTVEEGGFIRINNRQKIVRKKVVQATEVEGVLGVLDKLLTEPLAVNTSSKNKLEDHYKIINTYSTWYRYVYNRVIKDPDFRKKREDFFEYQYRDKYSYKKIGFRDGSLLYNESKTGGLNPYVPFSQKFKNDILLKKRISQKEKYLRKEKSRFCNYLNDLLKKNPSISLTTSKGENYKGKLYNIAYASVVIATDISILKSKLYKPDLDIESPITHYAYHCYKNNYNIRKRVQYYNRVLKKLSQKKIKYYGGLNEIIKEIELLIKYYTLKDVITPPPTDVEDSDSVFVDSDIEFEDSDSDVELEDDYYIYVDEDNNVELVEDYTHDLIKKSKVVKVFDLGEMSPLGKYIRNYINQNTFEFNKSIYVDNEKQDLHYYGINRYTGNLTTKVENFTNEFVNNDTTINHMDDYITMGFKRNSLIFPYIINLEFLFDDTSDDYKFGKYYGMYCDSFDLYENQYVNQDDVKNTSYVPKVLNSRKQIISLVELPEDKVDDTDKKCRQIVEVERVGNKKNIFYSDGQSLFYVKDKYDMIYHLPQHKHILYSKVYSINDHSYVRADKLLNRYLGDEYQFKKLSYTSVNSGISESYFNYVDPTEVFKTVDKNIMFGYKHDHVDVDCERYDDTSHSCIGFYVNEKPTVGSTICFRLTNHYFDPDHKKMSQTLYYSLHMTAREEELEHIHSNFFGLPGLTDAHVDFDESDGDVAQSTYNLLVQVLKNSDKCFEISYDDVEKILNISGLDEDSDGVPFEEKHISVYYDNNNRTLNLRYDSDYGRYLIYGEDYDGSDSEFGDVEIIPMFDEFSEDDLAYDGINRNYRYKLNGSEYKKLFIKRYSKPGTYHKTKKGHYYYSINGSLEDIAQTICDVINSVPYYNRELKAYREGNFVVVRHRSIGSKYNGVDKSVKVEMIVDNSYVHRNVLSFLTDNYIKDRTQQNKHGKVGKECIFTFKGGTDDSKTSFVVNVDDVETIVNRGGEEKFIKTSKPCVYSKILSISPYITEDGKIDTSKAIMVTDSNGRYINLISSNKIALHEKYYPRIGMLTFFPVRDFDFDNLYSIYGENRKISKEIEMSGMVDNKPYKTSYYKPSWYYDDDIMEQIADADIDFNDENSSLNINTQLPYTYERVETYGKRKAVDVSDIEMVKFESDKRQVLDNEYSYYMEYYLPLQSVISKTSPYISKWAYVNGGKDSCENPYRLNMSKIFGTDNFSSNMYYKGGDINLYTHSMPYYLMPKYIINSNGNKEEIQYPFDINFYQYIDFGVLNTDYMCSDMKSFIERWKQKLLNCDEETYNRIFTDQDVCKRFSKKYSVIDNGTSYNSSSTMFRGVKFNIHEISKKVNGDDIEYVDKKRGKYNGYKFTFMYVPMYSYTDSFINKIYFVKNDNFKFICGLMFINVYNSIFSQKVRSIVKESDNVFNLSYLYNLINCNIKYKDIAFKKNVKSSLKGNGVKKLSNLLTDNFYFERLTRNDLIDDNDMEIKEYFLLDKIKLSDIADFEPKLISKNQYLIDNLKITSIGFDNFLKLLGTCVGDKNCESLENVHFSMTIGDKNYFDMIESKLDDSDYTDTDDSDSHERDTKNYSFEMSEIKNTLSYTDGVLKVVNPDKRYLINSKKFNKEDLYLKVVMFEVEKDDEKQVDKKDILKYNLFDAVNKIMDREYNARLISNFLTSYSTHYIKTYLNTNRNVEYINSHYNDDPTDIDFRVTIEEPKQLRVYDIFGSRYDNISKTVDMYLKSKSNLVTLNRYNGYFEPLFRDVVIFNDIQSLNSEYLFTNTSFDDTYEDEYGKFGIIKNMYYHEFNKNKTITENANNPISGDYALKYTDYDIFSNIGGYFVDDKLYCIKDEKSMFGTKIMETPDEIYIDKLKHAYLLNDYSKNSDCELMYNEVKDNKTVEFYLYLRNRVMRYFLNNIDIYNSLKYVKDGYKIGGSGRVNKNTYKENIFTEFRKEYVEKNIINTYKVDSVNLWVRSTKMNVNDKNINNNYTSYLGYSEDTLKSKGFRIVRTVKMDKLDGDNFNRKITYDLKDGYREDFAFTFTIKKI